MVQPQDIAEIIDNCLRSGNPIHQGSILGAANANSKVRVELPYPLPGIGRVVSAIAGNDCLGGQATVLRADDGTWYALSDSQRETTSLSVVTSRRRRAIAIAPVIVSPFKVLFAIEEDGKVIIYIGGDRSSPTKLIEIPLN